MKKTFKILMIVLMVALLFSCKKEDLFLNKQPLGEYSEGAVWSDPALVETFVNSMYRDALGLPLSTEMISNFTDESNLNWNWGINDFNKCLMTPDGLVGWVVDWGTCPFTTHFTWNPLYSNVRRSNIFFSNINSIKGDQTTIDGLKGEVYFLRAWTYYYLTNLYGGVPLITKAYTLTDQFEVPRNTYKECINFIAGQLDSSAMYLPDTYPTDGRVSKGAALAFKSRVLLQAASDLHNPAKNSIVTTGFSNPELLGYTDGTATERWTAAKNAAKAVIDLGKYSLYKPTPAPGDSVAQNFVELFTSMGTNEDILLQFFTAKTDEGWDGYNPGLYCGPNGYHNWGANAPLGELVDDYEMKDGSKFDWTNPVEKANPYANRDARFYATILYEGVPWKERPADGLAIDPYSKIQVGYVYNTSGVMIKPGLDTPLGPIEDWNSSKTGYFLRKFIDASIIDAAHVKQAVPFRYLRYGEVLLNYAEACIELGQDAEARTYINMIRTRAGQPDLPALTGDALRQACRHERRIELAFENERVWDVRRWLIGPAAYKQTNGVKVSYTAPTATVDSYRQPDGSTWSVPVFSLKDTPDDARTWLNKAYFFPIMRAEMNKNTKLIQNPGYQ
jgi:hypothetical protein